MSMSNALKKTAPYEAYPILDKREQGYMDILLSDKLNSTDAEENLVLLFQHQANKFKHPKDTCDLITTIVTITENRNKISDAVEKMAKNGDGVTQYISTLRTDFLLALKQS